VDLATLWFILIAVLWAGFFFLEGFDFGVGILAVTLTKDEAERSQALEAIGPVWDADEVWLITAAAAIFAAFPAWYSTLFPAAYLPLLLVVVGLIIRAVSIEYRHRRSAPQWRRRWDVGIAAASAALPFLFGVFWAGLLQGVPIGPDGPEQVSGLEIITPYSILGGTVLLAFSLAHGAVFLALKTRGHMELKARRAAGWLIMAAGSSMTIFAVWTFVSYSRQDVVALGLGITSVAALCVTQWGILRGRFALAFLANGVAVLGYTASIFFALAPNAVPSSLDRAYDLTLSAAAAADYPLMVMTIVAAFALPIVLAYQAWSFWVFRARIARQPEPSV